MSVLWCYELHLKYVAEEVTGPKEGRSYSFLDKCTCYQTESSIFMFIHVEHIDSVVLNLGQRRFLCGYHQPMWSQRADNSDY